MGYSHGKVNNAEDKDLRCKCNRLLAQVTQDCIVLKCPRCKRHAFLPMQGNRTSEVIEIKFG